MKRRMDRIVNYYLENKLLVLGIIISGLFFDGLMCLVPLLTGDVINSFSNQEASNIILVKCLILLGFILFVQINRFFKRYFVRLFSNKIVFAMRKKALDSILHFDSEEFYKSSRADLLNKNLSDITDTAEGIRKVTTEFFDSIVILIGYFVVMMVLDYKITLCASIFVIASIVIAGLVKKVIYTRVSAFKASQSKMKESTLMLIENELSYRGLGVSNQYNNEFLEQSMDFKKKSIASLIYQSSLEPLYNAISLCGLFFVIYFGGKNVINGVFDLGSFTALLNLFVLASTKASKVGKVFNSYTKASVSWERIKPLLASEKNDTTSCVFTSNEMVLNNVTFGFDLMLKNMNYSFSDKMKIGITGPVHSGKSTLAALLSGLYKYEGSISYFGLELADYPFSDLKIAYMPSDIELFNVSIKDNILLGSDNDYIEASKKAMIYDEIMALPQGFSTIISHSQSNFSLGQQKRIVLARMLAHNPKMMILDDAFSSTSLEVGLKIIDNIDCLCFITTTSKEILDKMDYVIDLGGDIR